jgi:hypothetical protein
VTDKRTPEQRERDLVQQLVDEEQLEDLLGMPEEQLHTQLRKGGLEPGKGPEMVAKAIAKADGETATQAAKGGAQEEKKPAVVVDLAAARARRRTVVMAAIALAAGVAVVVGITKGSDIVAYFSPAPPLPSPSPSPGPAPVPTMPPGPTPQQLANTLWNRAWLDCRRHYYGECEDEKAEAEKLDPGKTGAHAGDVDVALGERASAAQQQARAKLYVGAEEKPLRVAPKKGR